MLICNGNGYFPPAPLGRSTDIAPKSNMSSRNSVERACGSVEMGCIRGDRSMTVGLACIEHPSAVITPYETRSAAAIVK